MLFNRKTTRLKNSKLSSQESRGLQEILSLLKPKTSKELAMQRLRRKEPLASPELPEPLELNPSNPQNQQNQQKSSFRNQQDKSSQKD